MSIQLWSAHFYILVHEYNQHIRKARECRLSHDQGETSFTVLHRPMPDVSYAASLQSLVLICLIVWIGHGLVISLMYLIDVQFYSLNIA
jgi:hypothetical protein